MENQTVTEVTQWLSLLKLIGGILFAFVVCAISILLFTENRYTRQKDHDELKKKVDELTESINENNVLSSQNKTSLEQMQLAISRLWEWIFQYIGK
jgi:hypothetical protein